MSVGQRFETMTDIDHSRQSAALGGLVASRRHVFEHHVSVCAVCFAGGGQRNGYVCVSHRVRHSDRRPPDRYSVCVCMAGTCATLLDRYVSETTARDEDVERKKQCFLCCTVDTGLVPSR